MRQGHRSKDESSSWGDRDVGTATYLYIGTSRPRRKDREAEEDNKIGTRHEDADEERSLSPREIKLTYHAARRKKGISRREDKERRILPRVGRRAYLAASMRNDVSLSEDKELFANNNSLRWADEEREGERERERES